MRRDTFRRKSRDQIIRGAQKDLPHRGDIGFSAPRPALQHQTCFSGRYVQDAGCRRVRIDGGDAMLRFGPGHMTQQPGTRGIDRKIHRLGRRYGLQIDDAILKREWPAIRKMKTAEDDDGALTRKRFFVGANCFSDFPRQLSQAITAASGNHIRLDVRDIEYQ